MEKSSTQTWIRCWNTGCFNSAFVYNEAGYQTHIRTWGGTESVATDIGYHWKGFGRATAWKQAQTVQFVAGDSADGSTSRQSEIGQLMQVMAVQAAKQLQVDMNVQK